jgi:prepilin peptidase CpaA
MYYFLLLQTFAVALLDIKHRKISNHWIAGNIVLFAVCLVMFPDSYALNFSTFLHSFSFILVGFILYLFKVMGAGDSKYLFSLFLLMPPQWVELAFFKLLICTMAIGGFSLFTTVVQNFDRIKVYARTGHTEGLRECLGSKFPYAPVIFISWAWLGFQVL